MPRWVTMGSEGAVVIPHPERPDRQVLAFGKPKADVEAGASLNFPFGAKGHLTMRLRLHPGFQGARLSLADHFSLPAELQDGLFTLAIAPGGKLGAVTGSGGVSPTPATLETGKWHTLGFAWDCEMGVCKLTADQQPIADLPRLTGGPGVCYLRLRSAAETTDQAGMLIESVDIRGRVSTAPSRPAVSSLLPPKLNTPTSPHDPAGLPATVAPGNWQASSTTATPDAAAHSQIRGIAAVWPCKWDTITALTRGPSAAAA